MTVISFRTTTLSLLIIGSVLACVSVVEARTVIRTGESITLNAEQTVEGDFYGVANVLSTTGIITEDAVLVGGRVTLNGTVERDVLVTGGTVSVNATVGDDVRVVAGDVTISGPIAGDVVVVGGALTVLSSATIGGDLVFYGGRLEMNGQVSGDLLGTIDRVRLDGMVGGEVDITTTALTLGDRAQVSGVLRYTSAEQLVRGQGAIVEGEVVRNDPPLASGTFSFRTVLIPLLILLFSVLAWQLISPQTLLGMAREASTLSLKTALVGFGTFFFTPVLVGILVVSLLGSIVGFIVVLLYFTSLLLALIASGAVVGQLLARYSKSFQNQIFWSVLGTAVLYAALFIPVVGPGAVLGVVLWTLGTLVVRAFRLIR